MLKRRVFTTASAFAAVLALAGQSAAQSDEAVSAPDNLRLFFHSGSSRVVAEESAKLDQAARLFRDGNPVVMIVTGHADTVGDAGKNLDLSIARARAVAGALSDRGIPVDRLQVLGQGNSQLPVNTEDEIANADNRSVTITWQ